MGRLATGMATDRTEVTGQEGGPLQVELMPALRKVFGEIVDLTGGLGDRPALEEPQMLLLPRGDCTDRLRPKPIAPPTDASQPTPAP